MVDLIPAEIWWNHIFLKLPAKSLLRFKCVCKAWNRVISDPEFVRKHFDLHRHNHVILELIYRDCSSHSVVVYDANDTTTTTTCIPIAHAAKANLNFTDIIGSSNGLLCGLIKKNPNAEIDTIQNNRNSFDLAICNPSTREFKVIPKGPEFYPNRRHFGFHYDPLINDASVVYFDSLYQKEPSPSKKLQVHIYSIKSNSWRKFDAPNSSLVGVAPISQACCINGSIYWIANNYLRVPNFYDMLVFNIKDREFRKVQLPRGWCCEFYDEINLSVLGSSALALCYTLTRSERFVMWTLKEEGESKDEWIKLMDLDVSLLCSVKNGLIQPLCLTRNQKVLVFSYNFRRDNSKLMLYDLVSKEREDLSIDGIRGKVPCETVAYAGSLVTLKNISCDDRSG